jgi:hypothetical protein
MPSGRSHLAGENSKKQESEITQTSGRRRRNFRKEIANASDGRDVSAACPACASCSRLGTFRTYTASWFRDSMRIRKRRIRAMRRATQERGSVHQDAAFAAFQRGLLRLLLDLAETVEGHTKIANMVRDNMKSIDEEGLSFASANES